MKWTTPADWRDQVRRLWDRGELLRACVARTDDAWPLRLTLKGPGASDLSDRFEAVREWVGAVAGTPHVRIEWREWTHRVQGRQRLPASIWIESPEDALAFIGQRQAAECYRMLWRQTAAEEPALLAWLTRRPLEALKFADRWERLLAVVRWLKAHPRPRVYLRQVDAPGVDSKFIEAHRGVLAEWLDLALPPEAIDEAARGAARFAGRYGFLDKPLRIRFRLLDAALLHWPGCAGLLDVTLDAASFAALAIPVARVFITENETNFLAFPKVVGGIVIFGAGYGWEPLSRAAWLRGCDVCYWGDIDTHGFAILDELRSHFPHAASFLMDEATLRAHRVQWGNEPEPVRHDLSRLTPAEAALYDALRFDRIQPHLRLEQERIGYGWIGDNLGRLFPAASASRASSAQACAAIEAKSP